MYEKRANETVLWFLKSSLDKRKPKNYVVLYVKKVIMIQRNVTTHLTLQKGRRDILRHFWHIEAQNEMCYNNEKVDSPEYEKRN
jgi:hypothetical protein